jgi:hypothetical protein
VAEEGRDPSSEHLRLRWPGSHGEEGSIEDLRQRRHHEVGPGVGPAQYRPGPFEQETLEGLRTGHVVEQQIEAHVAPIPWFGQHEEASPTRDGAFEASVPGG